MADPEGERFISGGRVSLWTRASDWWVQNCARIVLALVFIDVVAAVVAASAFAVWAWGMVSPTAGIAAAGVEAQTAVVAAALFGHWLTHFRRNPSNDAPDPVPVDASPARASIINLPAADVKEDAKRG